MFGNPGGAISADMSIEAFEDDVKVTGRQVCSRFTYRRNGKPALKLDPQRARDDQREPVYPILPTLAPCAPRSAIQRPAVSQRRVGRPAAATTARWAESAMAVGDGRQQLESASRARGRVPQSENRGRSADESGRVHGEQP
jgi:hypothetical protein